MQVYPLGNPLSICLYAGHWSGLTTDNIDRQRRIDDAWEILESKGHGKDVVGAKDAGVLEDAIGVPMQVEDFLGQLKAREVFRGGRVGNSKSVESRGCTHEEPTTQASRSC